MTTPTRYRFPFGLERAYVARRAMGADELARILAAQGNTTTTVAPGKVEFKTYFASPRKRTRAAVATGEVLVANGIGAPTLYRASIVNAWITAAIVAALYAGFLRAYAGPRAPMLDGLCAAIVALTLGTAWYRAAVTLAGRLRAAIES